MPGAWGPLPGVRVVIQHPGHDVGHGGVGGAEVKAFLIVVMGHVQPGNRRKKRSLKKYFVAKYKYFLLLRLLFRNPILSMKRTALFNPPTRYAPI